MQCDPRRVYVSCALNSFNINNTHSLDNNSGVQYDQKTTAEFEFLQQKDVWPIVSFSKMKDGGQMEGGSDV